MKDRDIEAFKMGFNFLEEVLGSRENNEDQVETIAKQIGYKRQRAGELLMNPERLRLTEMIRMASRSGLKIEIIVSKV